MFTYAVMCYIGAGKYFSRDIRLYNRKKYSVKIKDVNVILIV